MLRALAIVVAVASSSHGLDMGEVYRTLAERRACRDSLLQYTEYTHARWDTHDHHRKLAHHLEVLERRAICDICGNPITRLGVFAPPRTGKTELSLRRFSSWAMGRNPGWHVISAMSNGDLAQDTGAETRDIVRSERYRHVFPGMYLQQDAASAKRWIVRLEAEPLVRGVYFCGGVDGSFPGRGGNCINIDDPHRSAQEADSPRLRDLAAKAYFGDLRMRGEHPQITLLTNTRRHEDDLAGRILPPDSTWTMAGDEQFFCCGDKDGWHVLRMRAVENEDTDRAYAVRSQSCPPEVDPVDHMRAERDYYISKGEQRYWHSEYQQDPTPESGTYCKAEWYEERYDAPPEGLWVYGASDVAVTKKREGRDPDFTEHVVFGLEGVKVRRHMRETPGGPEELETVAADRVYILDWWYGQETSDVWTDEMIALCRLWDPMAWFSTKGPIRAATEGFITREMHAQDVFTPLEWLSDMLDKEAKGRPFQGYSRQGRVLFPRTAWADRAIKQCVSFPTVTHDDAFDALANVCRAMAEMPQVFANAPIRKPGPVDSYEYVGGRRGRRGRA